MHSNNAKSTFASLSIFTDSPIELIFCDYWLISQIVQIILVRIFFDTTGLADTKRLTYAVQSWWARGNGKFSQKIEIVPSGPSVGPEGTLCERERQFFPKIKIYEKSMKKSKFMKKKSKFMKKNQNLWKINEKKSKCMKNKWKINENLWKIYEKIKIYEKKSK